MIGSLTGKIHRTTEDAVIVDVQGVGYEVHVPKNTLLTMVEAGAPVSVEIYTHVSENNLQLFGFLTPHEKSVFKRLISVSGIGPKLGLSVISDLPLADLFRAIADKDVAQLTRISGVGKKMAERIVIELKDKFKDEVPLTQKAAAANDNPSQDVRLNDVVNALISLGYPAFQAKKVANGLTVEPDDTVQTLIKKSLGNMAT